MDKKCIETTTSGPCIETTYAGNSRILPLLPLILSLFTVTVTSPTPLHATGVGIAVSGELGAMLDGDVSGAGGVSLGCSVKMDRLPIYWSMNMGAFFWGDGLFDDSAFDVTLTGDYWIINPQFAPTWSWYLGVGGAISGGLGTDNYIAAGPRLCAGVDTFLMDGFSEIFIQLAAQGQAMLAQSGGYARLTFPVEAGMRLWY